MNHPIHSTCPARRALRTGGMNDDTQGNGPETQALLRPRPELSPRFISADDAAVYAHDLIGNRRDKEFGGFILSKDGRFYATLPVCSDGNLFRPSDVLSRASNGDMVPPQGYVLEGLYHSHAAFQRTILAGDPESELQDNFFSLMDLRMAIAFRHNYPRLYLSSVDQSLICYAASGSAQELALEPLLMLVHPQTPDHLEQSYPPSIFLPSHLLSMVHVAGELTVVLAGSFWRRRGRISAGWREWQAQILWEADVPPIYGPALASADAAALFAHSQLSQGRQTQQAGFILKHSQTSSFICTRPLSTVYRTFDRPEVFPRNSGGIPQLPEGYQMNAVYHTADVHRYTVPVAQARVLSDFLSPDNLWVDFLLMQATPGTRAYFSAPEGALLSYRRFSEDAERELIASVTHPDDFTSPLDRQLARGQVDATAYVRRVAAAFVLQVVKTDAVWTQAGQVMDNWVPFAPVVE